MNLICDSVFWVKDITYLSKRRWKSLFKGETFQMINPPLKIVPDDCLFKHAEMLNRSFVLQNLH